MTCTFSLADVKMGDCGQPTCPTSSKAMQPPPPKTSEQAAEDAP
jgi:hypothetical protein